MPGNKLVIAIVTDLALGFLPGGRRHDSFKYVAARLFYALSARDDGPAIQIHVLLHVLVHEGILVDPAYTGPALVGLIELIRQGKFNRDSNLVFIHTGGTAALFGYVNSFAEEFDRIERTSAVLASDPRARQRPFEG